jgi:ATPase subunit of ABC transporter with duplicated ATPase domains
MTEFECRHRLAQFLFRNKSAESAVSSLSDGERIRALLAAMLMGANPPELIILDEPTNHLDIDSITILEQAFQNYQGALLVISHDDDFLQNININRKIYTPLKYES